MIKIFSDSQIPNIKQKLSEFFADEYSLENFVYHELTSNDLKDVDALLVRSTIQVDKKLCDHSSIKFVGSATAGIDHLDIEYLDAQIFHGHTLQAVMHLALSIMLWLL